VSKLTTQTQKILDKERSVDSSTMSAIVEIKVAIDVRNAQGELAEISQKTVIALKRLKKAKEGNTDDTTSHSDANSDTTPRTTDTVE